VVKVTLLPGMVKEIVALVESVSVTPVAFQLANGLSSLVSAVKVTVLPFA